MNLRSGLAMLGGRFLVVPIAIRAVSDLRVNGHNKTLSPITVGCAGHSGLSCSVYSRDNLCPPLEKPLLAQCEYLSIKSLIM
jgi:hypothetical protein